MLTGLERQKTEVKCQHLWIIEKKQREFQKNVSYYHFVTMPNTLALWFFNKHENSEGSKLQLLTCLLKLSWLRKRSFGLRAPGTCDWFKYRKGAASSSFFTITLLVLLLCSTAWRFRLGGSLKLNQEWAIDSDLQISTTCNGKWERN